MLSLLGGHLLQAQDAQLSISAKLLRSHILIGEQTEIELLIRTSDVDNTFFIPPADTAIHHAEVLDFAFTDTIQVDPQIVELKARMLLTAFDSVVVAIPPFGVALGTQRAYSDPLYLQVTMPEVDLEHPDQYFDYKDPQRLRLTFYDYLMWLLYSPYFWGVIGIVLLVVAYLLFKKWQARPKPERIEPITPPSFLDEWQAVANSLQQQLSTGVISLEEYYNGLIFGFRHFLSQQIELHTLPLTAAELTQELRQQFPILLPPYEAALQVWVGHSQQVRFALMTCDTTKALTDASTLLSVSAGITSACAEKQKEQDTEHLHHTAPQETPEL